VGFTPAEVWDMTPREFEAAMKGRAKAHRVTMAGHLYGAWNAANLGRVSPKKKLPDLGKMMRKVLKIRAPEQTPQQQLRIVELLNQAFGGKDSRKGKGRKD